MKSLVQFIKEEYETAEVSNVKVVFSIEPDEFYINAPITYSESDMQIYLGDVLLPQLPSENDKYKNLLGKNVNNINDAYFEYDKFEHIKDSNINEFNLEWDKYYDEKIKDEDLSTFKITKLKYIILFDSFEILDTNIDDFKDVKKILDEVFHKLDSSNINKYPVKIKYNPDLLEFNK